jgi:biopolymer transport protein ExbB/TolQ
MKQEIDSLHTDIKAWHATLNTQGVWLFLATLGCWSVPTSVVRVFALFLVAALFLWLALQTRSDRRSFPKRIAELRAKVETEIEEGDSRDARLLQLRKIEDIFAPQSVLKSSWPYLVTGIFWLVTLSVTWMELLIKFRWF